MNRSCLFPTSPTFLILIISHSFIIPNLFFLSFISSVFHFMCDFHSCSLLFLFIFLNCFLTSLFCIIVSIVYFTISHSFPYSFAEVHPNPTGCPALPTLILVLPSPIGSARTRPWSNYSYIYSNICVHGLLITVFWRWLPSEMLHCVVW
jgi:hypothetical protein